MQHDGWTETLLQSELKGQEVSFRNMSLSGDRPNQYPRSKGFTPMGQYLQHVKADVVFAMFGYNESFSGPQAADSHKKLLIDFVSKIRSYKPNGKDFPRIVLFSPIAFEDLKDRNLPRGKAHNKNLSAFSKATQEAAREAGVAYVDLYGPTLKLYEQSKEALTLNGVHLNELGNKKVGEIITQALLETRTIASPANEKLRQAVLQKNWHWHNRYRATDGNDVGAVAPIGGFVDDQSNAEVLQHELVMLDVMTANRDKLVWATAQGKKHKVDDSNAPAPIKVISNAGGRSRSSNAGKEGTTSISAPRERKAWRFAKDSSQSLRRRGALPELINPVQMQETPRAGSGPPLGPPTPSGNPLRK